MTTTLPDTRPAKASRSLWGFCEGGHGQPPQRVLRRQRAV